jgi:maltose/maltodextrin transport system substrate-binding protein/arabinogalactan oligomer/maltooligosaccharide transport system substrate-binding protein
VGFGDIRDNFKVAGPAGEGPDIIIGPHDWLGELVINGLLAPIDLGDKADLFADAAIGAFTYGGVLYGMPYATENVAFFRNPDIVPDAPATWDEVTRIAKQLVAEGRVEYGYVIHQGDAYHFFPIMTAFGGYVFGRDAQGSYNPDDVGIDSAGSIAAAQWLDRMVKEGVIAPNIDWDTMHVLFEGGDAAMFITGPWSLPRLRESGIPYAISDIPAGPAGTGRPFLGVQGFMISAFSKDPLLAQIFLTEFVATEEIMEQLYVGGGRPSAFLPVLERTEDADLAALAHAGVNGLPMPAIPEMSAVWSAWGDALTLIFQQQQDAVAAFTNAASQIRTLIAQGE